MGVGAPFPLRCPYFAVSGDGAHMQRDIFQPHGVDNFSADELRVSLVHDTLHAAIEEERGNLTRLHAVFRFLFNRRGDAPDHCRLQG